MHVLYVSHTAHVSGGERSLIELLGALDGRVQVVAATPAGDLAARLRTISVPVRTIPGTDGSLRPHPLHTPKTIVDLARAVWSLRRIARREGIDLVHANSVRAGIVAATAARMGAPPAVVHVRDVLPGGPLARASRMVIGQGASAVVGNSAFTLERFADHSTDALLAVA